MLPRADWLAELDAATWSEAAAATATVAAAAAEVKELRDQCASGDEVACETSDEEEAKSEWLAKLDMVNLQQVAATISEIAELASAAERCGLGDAVACEALSRGLEAKQPWLAQLDTPMWIQAAATVSEAASSALQAAEQCESGDTVACDTLSHEVDAKSAWLAMLDTQAQEVNQGVHAEASLQAASNPQAQAIREPAAATLAETGGGAWRPRRLRGAPRLAACWHFLRAQVWWEQRQPRLDMPT